MQYQLKKRRGIIKWERHSYFRLEMIEEKLFEYSIDRDQDQNDEFKIVSIYVSKLIFHSFQEKKA